MRRAVSAVLALLLLCFTLMTRADSVSDDAEALRSFLQSHYGVTILMGDLPAHEGGRASTDHGAGMVRVIYSLIRGVIAPDLS